MFRLFRISAILIFATCATVPKGGTKDIEAAMVRALEWQEDHPIESKAPTDWTNGAYYTGVARAHRATGNEVFLDAIRKRGEMVEWQTYERFYHADDVAISYSYLYYNEQVPGVADLEPTAAWLNDHLNKDHEWKHGDTTQKEEILWWWCDALFMAPPVITEWASLRDEPELLDAMHRYYRETYDLLYDQEEHLFARDTRFVWSGSDADLKGDNGKKIFWSRGNGWVLGGLALVLEEMPADYEHRQFYVDLFREMASRVKELQPADGMWRVSLLEPEAWDHGETSGTGFFTFAMAWGVNNGLLDRSEYLPAIEQAWSALQGVQQPDGKVTWVQNIGYDPRPASAESWQNFGTGAFLMAASEVIKL